MSELGIDHVLQQIRAHAVQAGERPVALAGTEEKPDFGALLKSSVDQVNTVQKQAAEAATAFEKGDASVSLAEVMVAGQKSSISFQALTQVRNHLLNAYREIMNMQV